MGTTSESSNIYKIFKSVQEQLETIFKIDANSTEYKDYKQHQSKQEIEESKLNMDDQNEESKKREEFKNKLSYVSEKYLTVENRQLIIFLDSIDQLNDENHNLKWFFNKLPKNVKIVYSVLRDFKNIVENLKKKLTKEENIFEIKPITIEEGKNIFSYYMNKSNRKLSDKQQDLINKMIDGLFDITPLIIKLIFDIASKWKSSYNVPDEFLKCKTSVDVIKYLLKLIESEKFDNEILFKHFLFYLTLFEHRGISENVLEDILSIDDDVLSSIFKHHHPPIRRFPMSLIYRIKYELKDCIDIKIIKDSLVMAW